MKKVLKVIAIAILDFLLERMKDGLIVTDRYQY